MHSFLRSIGFSKYKNRKQLEPLYKNILGEPNRKIITTVSVDTSMLQFERDYAEKMGVALVGEVDSTGTCSIEHHFPYLKGDYTLEFGNIAIEKQTDKESYAGVCDDYRLGMTIIFYVSNIADYAKSKWFNYSNRHIQQVRFSGLSTEGAILLGTGRTHAQKRRADARKSERYSLMQDANTGNPEAIENLTVHEIDSYTTATLRAGSEDILSIVDTSFMPCGVECDHYMIVGNILDVHELINSFTAEHIYNLLVEANDITLNVAINKADLVGEPMVGRRFRGEIWLQGVVTI